MSNSSFWPIDEILSGATTPGLNGFESNENEGVLRIPETGASPSDDIMSSLELSLAVSYPTAKMQSVYSTAPTDLGVGNTHVLNTI